MESFSRRLVRLKYQKLSQNEKMHYPRLLMASWHDSEFERVIASWASSSQETRYERSDNCITTISIMQVFDKVEGRMGVQI